MCQMDPIRMSTIFFPFCTVITISHSNWCQGKLLYLLHFSFYFPYHQTDVKGSGHCTCSILFIPSNLTSELDIVPVPFLWLYWIIVLFPHTIKLMSREVDIVPVLMSREVHCQAKYFYFPYHQTDAKRSGYCTCSIPLSSAYWVILWKSLFIFLSTTCWKPIYSSCPWQLTIAIHVLTCVDKLCCSKFILGDTLPTYSYKLVATNLMGDYWWKMPYAYIMYQL